MCFLRTEVVSTSPNPQAGGPPLVGCPRLLIQFTHSYPPYRRPFLHPQPEDAPCRCDRDPLILLVLTHNCSHCKNHFIMNYFLSNIVFQKNLNISFPNRLFKFRHKYIVVLPPISGISSCFEVRHPSCVSQITKLNSRRLKIKTQLYYTYIYIHIYISDDGNS